jgi:hypothetical protein
MGDKMRGTLSACRATLQTHRAQARKGRRGPMPYAVNLAFRWQIEWLCTYLTISKQVVEMIVGPGRQPVKSTLPVPMPMPAKKVSCVGPADLKA